VLPLSVQPYVCSKQEKVNTSQPTKEKLFDIEMIDSKQLDILQSMPLGNTKRIMETPTMIRIIRVQTIIADNYIELLLRTRSDAEGL
jgi:hypothetical protein